MDIDLRLLRSFLVLAEDLHFGRAAARLHLSQSALSHQIRKIERDLGVQLLERTTRSVELTPAGRTLLVEGAIALREVERATDRTRAAAGGFSGLLRVGFLAGAGTELSRLIWQAFAERHPEWELDLREHDFSDLTAGLREGSVDVALVRPPFTEFGAEMVTLLVEPRVVLLAPQHRLVTAGSVSIDDLAHEPFCTTPQSDPVARRFWLALDHRGGRPAREGPVVSTLEEFVAAIVTGRGVGLAPASASELLGGHVVARPVAGLEPSRLAVAWVADHSSAGVQAFVDVALEVAADLAAAAERREP